jgi:hypothetical protein
VGGTRISFAVFLAFQFHIGSLCYLSYRHLYVMAHISPCPTTVGNLHHQKRLEKGFSRDFPRGFKVSAVGGTRISSAICLAF